MIDGFGDIEGTDDEIDDIVYTGDKLGNDDGNDDVDGLCVVIGADDSQGTDDTLG